ncbi:MAG: SGNH/GDSL hydrolase family protein, partial [Verrucomicrobiota bacterium]
MNSFSMARLALTLAALLCARGVSAQSLETLPGDAYFAKFKPVKAPAPAGLVLQKGDRLAICGDSITEQKMYSRLMETYLTVCVPELEVTVRQFGWSGETASGFLGRMTNDCLRFQPTIATTCYGMNDHRYRAYEEPIGALYREKSTAIVRGFKGIGTRVILGSPGCVGVKGPDPRLTNQVPAGWSEPGVEEKNLNLCTLRNIDIEIAQAEQVGFADVFWPMLQAGFEARKLYGPKYAIAGKDGVHPGWAGQTVMAFAFLKAMGLKGEIGTFTVDLKSGEATVSAGHEVVAAKVGEVQIRSSKYPFCATGEADKDGSIRSGMTLIPFNQTLNRLVLVAKNGAAKEYTVTWGATAKKYSAAQLAQGVNLAADFAENPFAEAFKKVEDAVGAKQAYETKQIKRIFNELAKGKFKTEQEVTDPELKALWV